MKIRQFDRFRAIFNPRLIKTLKPECKDFIGMEFEVTASWIIEHNIDYKGQWAMAVSPYSDFPYAWAPQEDWYFIEEQDT